MRTSDAAKALADRLEGVANLVPVHENATEKTAANTELDPGHVLNFLKFFTHTKEEAN